MHSKEESGLKAVKMAEMGLKEASFLDFLEIDLYSQSIYKRKVTSYYIWSETKQDFEAYVNKTADMEDLQQYFDNGLIYIK